MKYIITFEAYKNQIPRAVQIESKIHLMDNHSHKELTEDKIKKYNEDEEIKIGNRSKE